MWQIDIAPDLVRMTFGRWAIYSWNDNGGYMVSVNNISVTSGRYSASVDRNKIKSHQYRLSMCQLGTRFTDRQRHPSSFERPITHVRDYRWLNSSVACHILSTSLASSIYVNRLDIGVRHFQTRSNDVSVTVMCRLWRSANDRPTSTDVILSTHHDAGATWLTTKSSSCATPHYT